MPSADQELMASVISGVISDQISQRLKSLGESLSSAVGVNKRAIDRSIKAYFQATIERAALSRVLLILDAPAQLHQTYVPLDLTCDNEPFCEATWADISSTGESVIITGTAGAGKSTILKYMFLGCLSISDRIPILIELRTLEADEHDLRKRIVNELTLYRDGVDQQLAWDCIRDESLVLMLDGFDELSDDMAKKVVQSLAKLRKECPDVRFILTSRPTSQFGTFSDVRIAQVCRLTKSKAIEVATQVPYESLAKDRFIKDLRKSLYDSHSDFLGIPLLLLLMLIMYERNANIPTRKHIFYEQAFEALFHRHDGSKDSYERIFKSGLDIDEFRHFLMHFSAITHVDQATSFVDPDLRSYIEESLLLAKIDAQVDDISHDLLVATCVLSQDGLHYSFTHRTFQEYFAALFVAWCPNEETRREFLHAVGGESRSSDLLTILLQLNEQIYYQDWLGPYIDDVLKDCTYSGRVGKRVSSNFFEFMFAGVIINDSDSLTWTISDSALFHALFLVRKYLGANTDDEKFFLSTSKLVRANFEGTRKVVSTKKLLKIQAIRDAACDSFYGSEAVRDFVSASKKIQLEKKSHAQSLGKRFKF